MESTYIELDESALMYNVKKIKKQLLKHTQIMCVVKANAYGHGLKEIVSLLKEDRLVDWFAVFTFQDALLVRRYTSKKILVLSDTDSTCWSLAVKKNISVTISTFENLAKLEEFKNKNKLFVHLKVDTGLGRQGFLNADIPKVLIIVSRAKVQLEGLYSHFAGVEEKRFDKYSTTQYNRFLEWKNSLIGIGLHPLVHIGATAGVLRFPDFQLDIARLGIGLYGLTPSLEMKEINLKPVLSFKTRVSEIKFLPKGAPVAYDCTYVTKRDSKLAIVPVGYFDGIPRSLSNNGYMIIKGKKAPILGRIMMNMCILDVTDTPNVKKGDIVTIIGKDKTQAISVDEIAISAGTINYEIVTRLNPLVLRSIKVLQKKLK